MRGAAIECRINAGGVGKVNFLHSVRPVGALLLRSYIRAMRYPILRFHARQDDCVFSSTREAIRKIQSALASCHRRFCRTTLKIRSILSATPFSTAEINIRTSSKNREGWEDSFTEGGRPL